MEDSSDSFKNVSNGWQEIGGLFPTKEQSRGVLPSRYIPSADSQGRLHNTSSSEGSTRGTPLLLVKSSLAKEVGMDMWQS